MQWWEALYNKRFMSVLYKQPFRGMVCLVKGPFPAGQLQSSLAQFLTYRNKF